MGGKIQCCSKRQKIPYKPGPKERITAGKGSEGNCLCRFPVITAAKSLQGIMIKSIDLSLSKAFSHPLAFN